jgi:GTPase SAR1 family protein
MHRDAETGCAYFFTQAESLSSASGARLFEGFMRALNILATELTSNPKFRAKKVIDRALIETALSKVFSMPLSLNLLEEDDPLKILSRPDAAFLWQQTGYQGPLALKKKVIKNILNQLTADEEKHVPSSMIVYGDSGSGKSYLFQTLVKMLRLKLYNISGDHQENSDSTAFFLSLNQVRDPEIKGAGNAELESMINLEDAASALEKFLSLPNGHRGFIWLDDVHLASPKVKTYFLKRMRTLLENPTYTATVDGDAVERPTRNLFIGISMNPTDNQEKIKRLTKGGKTPTDHEVILATLSSGDGSEDLDQSWLKRWGLVLNLNFFPVEAKAPKLLENTRKSAKTVFDISQVHILVSPDAIEAVVKAFPNEDARTFLSTATRTLVKSPKTDTNRIIIRTPR